MQDNQRENGTLATKKRKGVEHRVNCAQFKKKKLDTGVGSRQTFDTASEWYDIDKSG